MSLNMHPRRSVAFLLGLLLLACSTAADEFGAYCDKHHKQCLEACGGKHMQFFCSDFEMEFGHNCYCLGSLSTRVDSHGKGVPE